MAFLTGRYPRSVGVTLSRTSLPREEVTIGTLLRRAGYKATAFGKTHYYDPLLREFDNCIDLSELEAWLRANPSEGISPSVKVLGPWNARHDPASVWLNSDCLPYAPDAEMPDTFFTRMAARFLEQRGSKPFFVWVGFYVTHSPFRFPIEFRGQFDPAYFAVPEVEPQDIPLIPHLFRNLTPEEKQGILAAYYTSVAYMDRNIGLILDALDRSGHADDTLVVFNSDHGYLLGQHGRFEKHCCYEEAIRTALIMRLPGTIAPAGAATAIVELIDVMPTILELCGVDLPANIQGKSIVRLLEGKTYRHREHVIVEYADNAEAMVRTDQWKLVYSAGNRIRRDGYSAGLWQPGRSIRLFDLNLDPGETTDVSKCADNSDIIKRLLILLINHMRHTARNPAGIRDTEDLHALLDQWLLPAELGV